MNMGIDSVQTSFKQSFYNKRVILHLNCNRIASTEVATDKADKNVSKNIVFEMFFSSIIFWETQSTKRPYVKYFGSPYSTILSQIW